MGQCIKRKPKQMLLKLQNITKNLYRALSKLIEL